MTFHERLEDYLNSILNFNWKTFSTLPFREQLSDWNSLLGQFDRLIREEHKLNGIDFPITTTMVRIYSKHFEKLPIESSLYTKINKQLISSRLYDFILDLEFEEVLKKSTAACDCKLRHEYHKKPTTENLKEVKVLFDGYYNHTLFECTKCNFQWISYVSDDSTGETIYEKHEETI
ncbi:MAG: hypothetical protein AB8B65_13760 [Kordia sp.]|uniref:hypothetical protein n=1 Tax=Kordia sp. TaxID=1965332 RepID=UPI00385E62E4